MLAVCLTITSGSQTAQAAWSTKTPMPTPRTFHCACAIDGKIYVFGGVTAGVPGAIWNPKGVDVYDPATDTWTTKGAMRTPRACVGACALSGKIYVFGGIVGDIGGSPVTTADTYDPATDTWTPLTRLPAAHGCPGVGSVGGKIFVLGGGSLTGGSISRVDEYNPVTDGWTIGPKLNKAKFSLGTGVVDSTIYVVGGTQISWPWTGISTVEAYTPPPDLSIGRQGATITLSWTGTLQEMNGPIGSHWQDITPAPVSPWTIEPSQGDLMKCYRSRLP